jgi:hypothetical protein
MTVEYKIDENDFLTHQLYLASKSERITKKRQRNKTIVPLGYFVLGVLFLFQDRIQLAAIFLIISALWFFIYPLWEKRHYVNHYKAFIKENYKERTDRSATLAFDNDFILSKDIGGEAKILTTELQEICEIPSHVFVRLKGGISIICPKDKIANYGELKTRLKELANHLKIKYEIENKWEWK